MPQLKYLDISYNHLPIVKKGAFKDLPSLGTIHILHKHFGGGGDVKKNNVGPITYVLLFTVSCLCLHHFDV